MNITSVLSNGYLQPSRYPNQPAEKPQASSASLSAQEQQILAQEKALKMMSAGAKVTTSYHYAVGPDGRRYITGASVTIEGDEKAVDQVGGGVKRQSGARREEIQAPASGGTAAQEQAGEKSSSAAASGKTEQKSNSAENSESSESADAVRELKAIEREVIAHEAAHKAAGGRFAGAVSYTTTVGPDGKRYITGGEVPIHVPYSSDPEENLRNMEQVRRAALAPGNPSGQDMSVAAQASSAAAQARQEAASKVAGAGESPEKISGKERSGDGAFKTGVSSVDAGLRYDRLVSGESGESDEYGDAGEKRPLSERLSPEKLEDAYAQGASKRGLWSLEQGFESYSSDSFWDRKSKDKTPNFDLAA